MAYTAKDEAKTLRKLRSNMQKMQTNSVKFFHGPRAKKVTKVSSGRDSGGNYSIYKADGQAYGRTYKDYDSSKRALVGWSYNGKTTKDANGNKLNGSPLYVKKINVKTKAPLSKSSRAAAVEKAVAKTASKLASKSKSSAAKKYATAAKKAGGASNLNQRAVNKLSTMSAKQQKAVQKKHNLSDRQMRALKSSAKLG